MSNSPNKLNRYFQKGRNEWIIFASFGIKSAKVMH